MKVGDIVRRKTSKGPVGPFMSVNAVIRGNVYAQAYNIDEPNLTLSQNQLKKYSKISLLVSENMIERLKRGSCTTVSHPITTRWESFVKKYKELYSKNEVLLVRFHTAFKNYEVTFVVLDAFERMSLGERLVEIIVGQRVA